MRDKAATREKILDAAESVFAEKGYHDAAMDAIARNARASKGALYFHFPSKEALFFSLIDRLAAHLEREVDRSLAAERGAVAKIEAALSAVLKTLSKRRRLAKLLLYQGYGLGARFEQKRLRVYDRFASLVQRYLEEAVEEGAIPPLNAQITAYAWLGALNELVSRWLFTGAPDPLEETLPSLVPLFLRGIGVNPTEDE